MNQKTYLQTQTAIARLAEILSALPLEDFVAALETADSIGPFLDATAWIQAQGPMKEIREIALAMLRVKSARLKVRATQPVEITKANTFCAEQWLRMITQDG